MHYVAKRADLEWTARGRFNGNDVGFSRKSSAIRGTRNEAHIEYGNGSDPKKVRLYEMSNYS